MLLNVALMYFCQIKFSNTFKKYFLIIFAIFESNLYKQKHVQS